MTTSDLSFANNFWGKDDSGVQVLLARMHDAKQTCEEIHLFFRERAAIEEEYSAKMAALSRRKLGSQETGNLKLALESIRQATEAMSKHHGTCAEHIRSQLDKPLEAFAGNMRSRRKTTEATVEKITKAKQQQNAAVEKARTKFETDCHKINGYSAQKNLLMGKELEKNNMKLDKVHASVDASRRDYQVSLRVLAETMDRWNKEWKLGCDKFEDLENERINFLKSNLWAYANIVSTVCVGDDEVCESIRVSLEKCDIQQDIETFVKLRGTGNEIMDPPEFINFMGGYSRESAAEQFRVAKFARPDAYDRENQPSPHHGSTTSASSSVYTNSVSSNSTADEQYESETRIEQERPVSQNAEKRKSWASPFLRKKRDSVNESSIKTSSVPYQNGTRDNREYSAETIRAKSPFMQRQKPSKEVLSMGDNMFHLDDNQTTSQSRSSSPQKQLPRDDPLVAALEKLKIPSSGPSGPSLAAPDPAFTSQEMEATSGRYSSRTNDMFRGQREPKQDREMVRPKSYVELRPPQHDDDYEEPVIDRRGGRPSSSTGNRPVAMDDSYDPYHRARSKSPAPHKDIYGAFKSDPYGRSQSPNPYDRSQPQQARTMPHNGYSEQGRVQPASSPYKATSRSTSPNPYQQRGQQRPANYGQNPPRSRSNMEMARPKSVVGRPQSRGGHRLPATSSDGRRVIRYSRAAYDYRAAIPEEVSFRKGDILLVLKMQEDGWWETEVLNQGRFGLAPSNFLVNLMG